MAANSAVVGILRAILTAQTAEFEGGMKSAAAKAQSLGRVLGSLGDESKRAAPQVDRLVKSFGGDRLLYQANNIVTAVGRLGGASKLTEAEQARVNRTVTEAIQKYQALGQQAPKAMLDLEQATRRVEQPTGMLTTRMVALGSAIGSFIGSMAYGAVTQLASGFAQAVSDGEKLVGIQGSFDRLATSIGQSGDAMLSVTRSATKGLISDLDLMQSANKAMLLGLPVTSSEMGTLASAAITLGRAMGQDATTSLNDLITALGRSSPLILDNLGLTVKVGEANEKYAAQLGKTVEQLTDNEKKLAFYNAAMDAARKKTDEIGGVQLTLTDQFRRLFTAIGNVTTQMAAQVNQGGPLTDMFGKLADGAASYAEHLDRVTEATRRVDEAERKRLQNGTAELRAAGGGWLERALTAIGQASNPAFNPMESSRQQEIADLAARLGIMGPERSGDVSLDAARLAREAEEAERRKAEAAERLKKAAEEAKKAQDRWNETIAEANQGWSFFLARLQAAPPIIRNTNDSLRGMSPFGFQAATAGINPLALMFGFPTDLSGVSNNMAGGGSARGFFGDMLGGLTGGKGILGMLGIGGGSGGIGGSLGSLAGGVLGSVIPGIGNMLGSIAGSFIGKGVGKLAGGIGKLFGIGGEHSKVNDMRDQFIAAAGGLDELNKRAVEAGTSLDALLRAKRVKDFEAAVGDLNSRMSEFQLGQDAQAQKQEMLNAAIERYGLKLNEIGPILKTQEMAKWAEQLITDWKLLTEAGVETQNVVNAMGTSVNEFLQRAVEFGIEVPESMRGMLESLLEQGILTDEAGDKLKDLSGINFGRTLEEQFTRVLEKIEQLIDAMHRIPGVPDVPDPSSLRMPRIEDPFDGMKSFAGGSGGLQDFGSGTLAMLHGEEEVRTKGQIDAEQRGWMTVASRIEQLERSLGRTVARAVADELPRVRLRFA